ncbi:MAG: hypothetical protein ACXVCH_14360 [Bdellovibrionota bacterium]
MSVLAGVLLAGSTFGCHSESLFPARGAPPEQFELRMGTVGSVSNVNALVQVRPGGKEARAIVDPLAQSIFNAVRICKPLQEKLRGKAEVTVAFELLEGKIFKAEIPDNDFSSVCVSKNLRDVRFPNFDSPVTALFRISTKDLTAKSPG